MRLTAFDNAKVILITLVVLGHLVINEGNYGGDLLWIIYSFHMPAFIFISGYFSKKESFKTLVKSVFSLMILLIFIQTIYDFFNHYWYGSEILFDYYQPNFTLWYLYALIYWKIALQIVIRWKWTIILFFILFITHRFWINDLTIFSVGRNFTFCFYFFIGYFLKQNNQSFNKFKLVFNNSILSKTISVSGLLLIFGLYKWEKINIPYQWFLGYVHTVEYIPEYSIIYLMLYQIFVFIISLIMILFFFMLVPKKEYNWTQYGKTTLSVYLLHGFVIHILKGKGWLLTFDTLGHIFSATAFSILIVYVLSQPLFNNFINTINNLTISRK